MIHLTRLNRLPLVLNADLIESIEATPDTMISLTTGQKMVVLEPPDEVVRRVVEFRRAIYGGILFSPAGPAPQGASPQQPVDRAKRIEDGRHNRVGS
jgi:flagellar protein FlbD